jgi:hypothetical protein
MSGPALVAAIAQPLREAMAIARRIRAATFAEAAIGVIQAPNGRETK